MGQCYIDHITVTAPNLESGATLVEKQLGVLPQTGGEHPAMGTHNLLLRLGNDVFLEVIAVNPDAGRPNRPRWFELDSMTDMSPASLKSWVVRTTDIKKTCSDSSGFLGDVEPMSRGKTNWLMTVAEDGMQPLSQGAPMLIEWKSDLHPANSLPDFGLSLLELQIHNPDFKRIKRLIRSIDLVGNIKVIDSHEPRIIAWIDTPEGTRKLGN